MQLPPLTPRTALAAGAATAATAVGVSTLRGRARRARAARDTTARAAAATQAQAALAASLADSTRHTLLAFSSRECQLCDALRGPLEEIAQQEAGWLDVVNIDADDGRAWALETLHYGVANVPTLVMLDARGAARARVGRPADVAAAAAAAERLVAVARGGK